MNFRANVNELVLKGENGLVEILLGSSLIGQWSSSRHLSHLSRDLKKVWQQLEKFSVVGWSIV